VGVAVAVGAGVTVGSGVWEAVAMEDVPPALVEDWPQAATARTASSSSSAGKEGRRVRVGMRDSFVAS
jgi:hypothetical protein